MLTPFAPPPGLNSDDTTFAVQGRWEDGSNVRFYNGKPQVVGGYSDLFTISSSSSICRSLLPFNRAGATTIAYGICNASAGTGTAALYIGTGLASPTARTPAGLGTSIFNWALAPWGSTLLAVPEGGTLYEQSASGTAAEVTQAPNEITHMLVTQERQVLALGCSEEGSGTFNALCIRGSDLEDYTDWTSSSSNNAFEHILDGGGKIVAGRIVGSFIAVWTNNALYLGQFIGDPSQTYRFDRVSEGCGLAGPNSVTVFNKVAYWLGPDLQVRKWTPGALPEIVPCPISKRYLGGIALTDVRYVTASFNARFNEVRFDIRNGNIVGFPIGNVENCYIAFNATDGAWFAGVGGRTAIVDDGSLSSLTTGYTGGPTVISADGAGTITVRLLDTGTFTYGGGSNATQVPFIRSTDFCLADSQRRLMIRSIHPDFENQSGTVQLTLTARNRQQSTAVTKGPYDLTTATTKKDFRASGMIFTVKFGADPSGALSNFYFRLGTPVFDVVPLGER